MSLRAAQAAAELHAGDSTNHPGGQRHDRFDQDFRGFPTETDDAQQDAPQMDVSIVQKMGSAVLGSVLTSLLVTPLDVVRIRIQSQQHSKPPTSSPTSNGHIRPLPTFNNLPSNLGVTACCREVFWVNNNAPYCVASPNMAALNNPTVGASATATAADCAAEEAQRKTFTSTFDGMRKIARNEGLATLWRGLTPTLVMAVPANVIYFAGYDWLRYSSASPIRRAGVNDTYIPLVAGSAARMLAAIAVGPIEMFRTRMQATSSISGTSHFRETLRGLQDMVGTQGYRSLWRGLGLTLWRDVPFSAIYWWGYELGRDQLTDLRERARSRGDIISRRSRSQSRSRQNHTETLVDSFAAGAGSGMVAALVTTPFDVGKTRQQVVRHAADSASQRVPGGAALPEELSMPRFLWHIFKEEGAQGLFKGWAARCLKIAPACAIMISSYEIGKKMTGDMNERREARREAA